MFLFSAPRTDLSKTKNAFDGEKKKSSNSKDNKSNKRDLN